MVEPGQPCPACARRVPHEKKPGSPKTKTYSLRVPVDASESFRELVDAAAAHIGALERPHGVYTTILMGLVALLQLPPEELPYA